MTRTRYVTVNQCGGGAACPEFSETVGCGNPTVNCAVGGWLPYGACSPSCGPGSQTRTRPVTQNAACGGSGCPTLSESAGCNNGCCPTNCVQTPWSAWGSCSSACSGTQTRTRSTQTPE